MSGRKSIVIELSEEYTRRRRAKKKRLKEERKAGELVSYLERVIDESKKCNASALAPKELEDLENKLQELLQQMEEIKKIRVNIPLLSFRKP